MNAAHLHLVLNHIPVLGTIFGIVILACGLWRKQDAVVRVALGLFVASGLGATGAYLTGEGAEEAVEGLDGVSHAAIEAHEEIALYAYVLAIVVGAASLAVLIWTGRNDVPRSVAATLLVVGVLGAGVMGYTANLGGDIRHSEIRAGATPTQVDAGEGSPGAEAHDEADEHDE